MKILHTSDWHLGKSLEGQSRINEQKQFINELETICDDNEIDLIIIAGDIYDTVNPPSEAEYLFYSAVKRLSHNGKRPIVIIAGNHDSSNRLMTSIPLSEEFGIIIIGTLKSKVKIRNYNGFSVTNSGEGFLEINKNNENAVILTVPYPSEKNLNQILSSSIEEKLFQKDYSFKIGEMFKELSKNFRTDTINIVTGHFYITGGETSNSERNIQLGGSYAVNPEVFPKNAQYIAMGHLHRPQHIKNTIEDSYYSGSPIQYSKSESGYSKCVYIADLKSNTKADVKKVYLKNYKPVEIWKSNNIEEAIEKCRKNTQQNCWVFLEIKTERVLLRSEIELLHSLKDDILEIQPIFYENDIKNENQEYEEKTLEEQFKEFYNSRKNTYPSEELIELFLSFANNIHGDDDIETDKLEN